MSATPRASQISKLHTQLKKSYKPIVPVDNRTLLEHLLYACLLENAPHELADEALARLETEYFDWNEVRVTTITELAEVLSRLPESKAAAARLKKNLHGMFETTYSFDLEELRKLNLGKAVQKFEKLPAMTPFVLAYVTQHGLGGHAIPLDSAALRFFWLAGIINEKEFKTGRVTGLERAIPKTKGIEFASLLHQAAVAMNLDANDEAARSILLKLNPKLDQQVADHIEAVREKQENRAIAKAKAKAKAEKAAAAEGDSKSPKAKSATKKSAPEAKKHAAKATSTQQPAAPKKSATKKAAPKSPAPVKVAPKKSATPTKKKTASKQSSAPKSTKKKSAEASKKKAAPKKSASTKKSSTKKSSAKKSSAKKSSASSKSTSSTKTAKSSSKRISKRKPR